MNKERFEAAFGKTPPSFEMAMRRSIQAHKTPKRPAISGRMVLVGAVVMVLLCGAAYAAAVSFGLLDLLGREQPVQPSAAALLQTQNAQTGGELPDVRFTLEQVLSDGEQIFFTLRATPEAPDRVMLVDADRSMEPSIEQSIDYWRDIPEEQKQSTTFEQAAADQGKVLVCPFLDAIFLGEETLPHSQPTLAYDGGDIVYVFAADYAAKTDEPLALRLRVNQMDPLLGDETAVSSWLTADVVPTGNVINYNWNAPRDLDKLGITITQLYVAATPVGLHTSVVYKPIDGADEFARREVGDLFLDFVDEEGNSIDGLSSTGWAGAGLMRNGYYLHEEGLASAQAFTGLYLKNGEELVFFSIEDAEIDPDGSAKPMDDQDEGIISISGSFVHPTADVALGSGASIPLLGEFDTEYSGIAREIERMAANVDLSVSADGFRLTVDQIAADDSSIWLSYTLIGDAPLKTQRNDPSIQGDYAALLTAPHFWAAIDGDTENVLWSTHRQEAFFEDAHTLKGWMLIYSEDNPAVFPEKFRLNLWTYGFANRGYETQDDRIDGTPFGYELTVDRSGAAKFIRTARPNTTFKVRDREIRVVNLSISALGGMLLLDETMPGGGVPTDFLILDEQGNSLPVESQGKYVAPGGKNSRHTMRHAITFVGGLNAKSIRLVDPWGKEIAWGDPAQEVVMPIDQALPFTAQFADGMIVVIEKIEMDENGMSIRYRSNQLNEADLILKGDGDESPVETETTPRHFVDRATGARVAKNLWRAERGAAPGARIKAETLKGIRSIGIIARSESPLWDQAIVIDID